MRSTRVAAAIVAALLVVAAPAAPAHEGNPDFRSVVDQVDPETDGLDVEVVNFDDSLRMVNHSGSGRRRRGLRGRAVRPRPGGRHGRAQPQLDRLLPQRRPLRRVGGARERRPQG